MIKIAIIDDDKSFCNLLEKDINKHMPKIINNFSIDIIDSNFSDTVSNNDFDIIFLDIDLKHINGINLSHSITSQCKKKSLIIFVTSRNDLIFDSLSVQPFYFVRKSNLNDDLIMTFSLLKKHYKHTSSLLTFQYNGRKTNLRKSDIVYIESDFHDVYITTTSDQYVYRSTLKAILNELNSKRFSRIQKSIVINFDYVKEIDENNNVILTTGNIFSINRSYKKEVLKELKEYLLLC